MQVKKAVITAAGRGGRMYPAASPVQRAMLPIADRDGITKPAIQIIAEEALESGIEEVCVVCAPGDEDQYRSRFVSLRENLLEAHRGVAWAMDQAKRIEHLSRRLKFAVQREPRGYGHAVSMAREFVGGDSFLLLLSDHLYLSHRSGHRCAAQLIEAAGREACSVAAVKPTREHLIGRYGTVSGRRVPDTPNLYQIERIIEKPSLSRAELELPTPGLRAGYYLCFFGMHVLAPAIFDILDEQLAAASASVDVQLTPALDQLARQERYLALEVQGSRYDIGAQFGLLQAEIALALAGPKHDEVLTAIVELLAETRDRRNAEQD